jgi:hypothetical protein
MQIRDEVRPRAHLAEPMPVDDLPEMDISDINFLNDLPPVEGLYHPEPDEQQAKTADVPVSPR